MRSSGRSLADFAGSFLSLFRADLYFGKLTFQSDRNQIDFGDSRRKETDIQGFGDTIAFENAENRKNTFETYNLRWKLRNDRVLNELSADYVDYNFNPVALNPNLPTFGYQGIIVFGGKDSTRDFSQKTFTFRDDLTLSNVEWHGEHVFKFGFKLSDLQFSVIDQRNPRPGIFFGRTPIIARISASPRGRRAGRPDNHRPRRGTGRARLFGARACQFPRRL